VFEVVWIVYASASALMVIYKALKCYFKSLLSTNNWDDVSRSCVYVHELNVRRIKLSHFATETGPFFFNFTALIKKKRINNYMHMVIGLENRE
jgi:hypothetical protein